MLVLSRKLQQEITIGDNVKVTVLKVKGNTVSLGIEAPRDVKVLRGELPRQESQQQIANVTVVFDGTIDRSESGNGGRADILRFARQDSEENRTRSISFREATPEPLQHNRLKQIAGEVARRS